MYSPSGHSVDDQLRAALTGLNLNGQSVDQLKQLLNDDSALDSKLTHLSDSVQSRRDSLLSSNRAAAESSVAKQQQIQQLAADVRQLLSQHTKLLHEMNTHLAALSSSSRRGSSDVDHVMTSLATAADTDDQQSEELVRSLLDGGVSLDAFLEQYLPLRSRAVQRRVKADKMKELVSAAATAAAAPQRVAPPTHLPNMPIMPGASGVMYPQYPVQSVAVPYPVIAPRAMPQPAHF